MNTDSYIRNMRIGNVLQFYNIRGLSWGETYESIVFPEGYEKPSKEAFEAKLKELIDAQPLKELREERNTRLAEVDWVFSGDYKLSPEEHALWVTYRKTLRELPSTTEDPANPTWPEKPSVASGETKTVNATAEFMRMMNENTKLSSKITALERRSTDQELKLIKISRLLEK
tara:strand:- start:154 stop:669 length:516 start_codon:yes stop_codon:yes gene_type:complete